MDRVIRFYLCSHPEHIPHFNHNERKYYPWLKVPFSISLHALGIGKSLKSELLELNLRVLGNSIPRKKKGKMSQNVPWILCRQLSTVWEQEEKNKKNMEGPQVSMLPRMRA